MSSSDGKTDTNQRGIYVSSILLVDSDGKALTVMQRRLRKNFETHIALGARAGFQRLEEDGPYDVVMASFSMAEMDGINFLAKVREISPESTRILLSASPMDVTNLLRAINDAKVFHLLSASCDDSTLQRIVGEGVDRFSRISTSTRNMNEIHAIFAKAVHELVCWLRSDVRDMISPVLPLLRSLCQSDSKSNPTVTETAFLLSVIGLIALPSALLDKIIQGQELSADELLIFAGHPEHAVEWVSHLPQLRDVVEILRGYSALLPLSLLRAPGASAKPDIPAGAALLAMVMEYRLAHYAKLETAAILSRIRSNGVYSATQVKALETELIRMDQSVAELTLDKLRPGMIMAKAVTGERDGKEMVLVPEGYELSRTTIVFLLQSARHGQVREPVLVRGGSLIPQADSENA